MRWFGRAKAPPEDRETKQEGAIPATFVQGIDPDTAGAAERSTAVAAATWDERADVAVRGLLITGVFYAHDYIEVHMDDVILTGYTEPFGIIGCQGVGPSSITQLIGRTVDRLSVVEGECVAIDSGEMRLAFRIGGPPATGSESVRLYLRGQDELGIPSAHWIW